LQFGQSAQTHQTQCKVDVALKLEDAHFVKYRLFSGLSHASKNGFDAYDSQKVDMCPSIYDSGKYQNKVTFSALSNKIR
jgi:hypothetical protein